MDTDYGPGHSFEASLNEELEIPEEHIDMRQGRRSIFSHSLGWKTLGVYNILTF
jgi:hypothetical protein